MSDEKRYTMRDMVLAQREAFRAGVNYATSRGVASHPYPDGPCHFCDKEAARLYPLPAVTRPRVVHLVNVGDYRIYCDRLEWRASSDEPWKTIYTEIEMTALADLLSNPTETVEEDA